MLQEFPDGLVVKTACLHCQGSGGSIPGKETKILHAPEAQPGEKKKRYPCFKLTVLFRVDTKI